MASTARKKAASTLRIDRLGRPPLVGAVHQLQVGLAAQADERRGAFEPTDEPRRRPGELLQRRVVDGDPAQALVGIADVDAGGAGPYAAQATERAAGARSTSASTSTVSPRSTPTPTPTISRP